MTLPRVANRIQDHLRDTATRKRLYDRFTSARNQLTTSIGEAAKLAAISPEKARYAEVIGILSPSRSHENKEGAHRRYSLGELNRLIVMGDLLERGFSMNEIANFLTRDRTTVDDIVESIQASDLATRLREAETAYVQRMLIPRLLYFVQCLLLGDVVDCSIAIVLPVAADSAEAMQPVDVNGVDDLPHVGPSLVGWHSRSHPYCVLFMHEPRMDDATRYELRSVDEMCREAGVPGVDDQPTGAYLLIEREFAHLLHVPTANRSRTESETVGAEAASKHPNARSAAYRLLRLLQQPADDEGRTFGHRFSSGGDGMVYSAPEFMSDMRGDKLLTAITELVVQLGNAVKTDASSQRGRWIFSAILLPDNPLLPPGQQNLVVAAQSEKSPHILGVTQLVQGKNEGLSTMAALSGHVLLRRTVESTNAAVADSGVTGEPGPALALPVLGAYGSVLAVLYIRAKYADGTSTHKTFTFDDELILRVIGHIIGGVVAGARGNYLERNVLAGMIEEPRNVERFFREFKSANGFWVELEDALQGHPATPSPARRVSRPLPGSLPSNPITLLAVDIDGHSNLVNIYGSITARHLVRAVGRRIAGQPLLTGSPLMSASDRPANNLYHMYGDRFYLLLENSSESGAFSFARNLRSLLAGGYMLELSSDSDGRSVPTTKFTLDEVSVRIMVIHYDTETLQRMLSSVRTDHRARPSQAHEPTQYVISLITSALDAGLSQGKQHGAGTIMYLDVESGVFRQLPEEEDRPLPQDKSSLGETYYSNQSPRRYPAR